MFGTVRRRCGRGFGISTWSDGLLLDKGMSESLLGVAGSAAVTVDVMRNLVDENVIKVKLPNGIEGMAAKLERVGA